MSRGSKGEGGIGSCRHCLGWSELYPNGACPACRGRGGWKVATCAGCRRRTRLLHEHCRLCRSQALIELGKLRIRGPVPDGLQFGHWQLFLAGIGVPLPGATIPTPERPREAPVTWQIPGQLALFQIPRDLTRFHRPTHANPGNPMLIHARAAAREITQARGWSHYLLVEVDDALVVLLSGYAPGDRISHSEIGQVDRLGLNVSRTAEVIGHLGLLNDDRQDPFDAWLDRKLADLAPRIATDVRAWADTLRHGGQRSKPRSPQTIRNYLNAMHPQLTAWSACYETLRETTPADVRTAVDALTGLPRKRTAVGLRSLFRFLRRTNRIFQDPTSRLKTGNPALPALCPLPPATLSRAVGTVTTPAARLILALAAIHAARPITLRRLQLDEVDFPNRRITINGHTRRLDELTARLLADYLEDRHRRWPHTLNTHLFVSEQTGHDHRPVGEWWINTRLQGIAATPNQIRMDRQLEEAMAYGPDALHLASVFGISERAAIRYAEAARQLLSHSLEQPELTNPEVAERLK